MSSPKKKTEVFQLTCPCCHSSLWIDPVAQRVMQFKKKTRPKGSLEDLLLKERKKKQEFERKFEATAELEKRKRKKAEEEFEKALTRAEKED